MTKLEARLVAITQPTISIRVESPEGLIAYCARVSNPENQDKDNLGLLDYCIRNRHWSVFEMANAVVEVEAPRDITRQLLRHRSFSFQEFSQRYSDQIEFTERDYRVQDNKNRQNSLDILSMEDTHLCMDDENYVLYAAQVIYDSMRQRNVAKECARVVLPEGLTMSRMYVNGTLRSWLHYLEVRLDPSTQKEHRDLAAKIKDVLMPAFPNVIR